MKITAGSGVFDSRGGLWYIVNVYLAAGPTRIREQGAVMTGDARRRFKKSFEKAELLSDSLKRTTQAAGKKSHQRERIQD